MLRFFFIPYLNRLFFLSIFLLTFLGKYKANNSWINFNQTYVGIPISEKGIYRISYNDLSAVLPNINTLNPKKIQIFHQGKEIAIYIEGENDNSFDNQDYIEFYANKNTGWLDSVFYKNTIYTQPRKDLSSINDTIVYFLTFNNSTANKRLSVINNQSYTPTDSITYIQNTVGFYPIQTFYNGEPSRQGGDRLGYSSTEGWFGGIIRLNKNFNISLHTPNIIKNRTARINGAITGQSNFSNQQNNNHHFRVSTGNTSLFDTLYKGFSLVPFDLNINSNSLISPNTSLTFSSINDLNINIDKQALAWLKIKYPMLPDANSQSVFDEFDIIPNSGKNIAYLYFTNFNTKTGVAPPIFYDLTSQSKIIAQSFGSGFRTNIPFANNTIAHKCYVSSLNDIKVPEDIFLINTTGKFTNYKNLEKNKALLFIYNQLLETSVNKYETYRSKKYNIVKIDVEELYMQFAYGIKKHPLAIRYFLKYVTDNWSILPQAVLLLGKAVDISENRFDTNEYRNNLVPTFGFPGADQLLTTGFSTHLLTPEYPIGRIAAKNNTELQNYLDKLIEYEQAKSTNNNDREWIKKVIHLSGGTTLREANVFKNYLANYQAIIEDTFYGGSVLNFEKTTTKPVQISFSDSIKKIIGKGVSLMTFFGHGSATGGFDQNIESPSTWPNQKGKYPILLANSCYSGNIHQSYLNKSISEEYIFEPKKGVVAFIAGIDAEYSVLLDRFSKPFYEYLAKDNYGEPLGKIINKVIRSLTSATPSQIDTIGINFNLHGDPMISIGYAEPDYAVNKTSVSFAPNNITSNLTSFEVFINIKNLGKALNQPIDITITRIYPFNNQNPEIKIITTKAPFNNKTINVKFPVNYTNAKGLNKISVVIDELNKIPEITKLNNSTEIDFFIAPENILPVYPYEFSVLPKRPATLKVSISGINKKEPTYLIEIDSNLSFTSPIKSATSIKSKGGIISWIPKSFYNNTISDSTALFWRVCKDTTPQYREWKTSSFQFINNISGWGQSHYDQFSKNNFNLINYNKTTRTNTFVKQTKEIFCETYGQAETSELFDIKYGINNAILGYNGQLDHSALHMAVLDSNSLNYWNSNAINLEQANSSGIKYSFFIYRLQNSTQQNAMANAIINTIPKGNYILIWTWFLKRLVRHAPFTPNLLNSFDQIGATNIRNLTYKYPFIILAKKGYPALTKQILGTSTNDKNIKLKELIRLGGVYGEQTTPKIGPSKDWKTAFWKSYSLEIPNTDSNFMDITGITPTNSNVVLYPNIISDKSQIDISTIQSNNYPYVRLKQKTLDSNHFTPRQLKYWYINYNPITDLALAPNIELKFVGDTINEGAFLKLSIAVQNISNTTSDSTITYFKISDFQNQTTIIDSAIIPTLKPDSSIIISTSYNTLGLKGINSLFIEVNPKNNITEQYRFNNIGQYSFYVQNDNENPLLDVTFDNIHILDREIVSPKSLIRISLNDNNEIFLLDSASLEANITTPSKKNLIVISNGNPSKNTTLNLPKKNKNTLEIMYNSNFQENGIYRMEVSGKDKNNNKSGDMNYIINFEVIKESSITHVVNYPNPFSTSTKFIFTLTGDKIPNYFKIQILTISGKIIREINQSEIGPIKIGQNITQYAWDGKDQFGDQLANGVYLYRVIAKYDNQDIKHRSSRVDNFFIKNFGKMYLLK